MNMHVCSFDIFICVPSMWRQEGKQKDLTSNSKQKSYLLFFRAFMFSGSGEFSHTCTSFSIT